MLTYWVGNVLQVGMEQEPQQELMQQSKDLWFDILFIIIIIIIIIYIYFFWGGRRQGALSLLLIMFD
jgi:heme/copper-type cytochrome/quinol oxidase subunit 2